MPTDPASGDLSAYYASRGLFLDGRWQAAASGRTYAPISPATEEPLGNVPEADGAEAAAAIDVAERGFSTWRATAPWDRARIMRGIADAMRRRFDDIVRLISTEVGKPLAQSRREVNLSIDQFEWYGEETKRIYGEILPGRAPGARIEITYEPVGIVAAFTAWNFPLLLLARKVAPALAAGCAVICRPAQEAPGSAMALIDCCIEAGLPAGVIALLTGDADAIAAPIYASPKVRKVTLTGSTAVGKKVLRASAETLKRVSMELGGHAPVIVCADADEIAVADLSVPVKFANAGQVCVAPTRFYVHESKLKSITERFVAVTEALRLGNGLDPTTDVGPLISSRRREQVEQLVATSRSEGARLLTGGERPRDMNRGFFYQPTVFADVPDEATILNEEPFGPIAIICAFRDLDEAIRRANGVEYALASYAFTASARNARQIVDGIEAGMVGVNSYALAAADAPFGGIKQSGFGREGGRAGLLDYLNIKYAQVNVD
jgi:succinate-semialdehyde dehydrogenase/glutarate-semialdehyde dehydrogenase